MLSYSIQLRQTQKICPFLISFLSKSTGFWTGFWLHVWQKVFPHSFILKLLHLLTKDSCSQVAKLDCRACWKDYTTSRWCHINVVEQTVQVSWAFICHYKNLKSHALKCFVERTRKMLTSWSSNKKTCHPFCTPFKKDILTSGSWKAQV